MTDHQAECGAAPRAKHTLFVSGSESGRGFRETVVGFPKEVLLPGAPGPIDSVSFGPSWVATAKGGNVYLSSTPGGAKEETTTTTTLHEAKGGWFGGGDAVVQVACGRAVLYGRTAKGQVLYWTRTEMGAFKGPYRYAELAQQQVTHVDAGPEHAVFVTGKGEIFGVGQNEDGRLGLGAEEGKRGMFPSPVAMKVPAGKRMVGAACGGTHTLLLDEEGGAWSCGADTWYQLCQGETWKVTKDRANAIFWEPKKVRAFEEVKVGGIAAGGNHSLFSVAVEEGGCWVEQGNFGRTAKTPARVLEVWGAGFGQYGQLGDRAYIHLAPLKLVKDLRILTFPDVRLPHAQLACGENHSAVVVVEPSLKANANGGPPPTDPPLTYRTQVYVWGHNLGAQCGTGKAGNLAKPVTPLVVEGANVEKVVCGYDYTGFVVREEE